MRKREKSLDVYQTITGRRSVRRFKQDEIESELLTRCINAARLAPSARNRQCLEYVVIQKKTVRDEIFRSLSWAGYLRPRWTPAPKERPTAYVVMVTDGKDEKDLGIDVGAAAENIMLTAESSGIGACALTSFKESEIRKNIDLPERLSITLVIALGYPAEKPVAVKFDGSVKYWRDDDGVLNVPKRSLETILHEDQYRG